jgi:uncharacterized membrane protein
MEQLVAIGIIVVFAGIAIIIIGSLLGAGKTEVKWGVGGFIGPIPFGFANDKAMLYAVIAVAIIVFVISLLMSQKLL